MTAGRDIILSEKIKAATETVTANDLGWVVRFELTVFSATN